MVVEDGTGLPNSNAYASVLEVTNYFTDRGIADWNTVSDKEGAIVRATQAVDAIGLRRYVGSKSTGTQALCWPRTDAIDVDGFSLSAVAIPTALKNAVAIAALIEGTTPGSLQADMDRGGMVKTERVEGAVTVEYFNGAPSGTIRTALMAALAPILVSGGFITVRV